MAMIPLVDRRLYDRLCAIQRELRSGGYADVASVFSAVGSNDPNAPFRFMFVGQATRGWDDVQADYTGNSGASSRVVSEYLTLTTPKKSVFWGAIRLVMRQVLMCADLALTDDNLMSVVGWSNLLKIGLVNRNPRKKNDPVVDPQSSICSEALRAELSRMKPTATIMLSGGEFNTDILFGAFGSEGWRGNVTENDRVSVKVHPEFGPILWTDHPRSLRAQGGKIEREVLGFVAGYLSALAGHETLIRRSSNHHRARVSPRE
jgi:hypothetical protein